MSVLVKHFIKTPRAYGHLDKLKLNSEEKNKLTELLTLLYHQKLLNKFLEHLEEEDKKIFLELVLQRTDDNYLEFLHLKIVNLEEIVSLAVDEIEAQIEEDLNSFIEEDDA